MTFSLITVNSEFYFYYFGGSKVQMKNILLAGAVALAPVAATAAPVIYTGYDVGAGDLASAPTAKAASDAFDAAVMNTSLTDFEAGPSTDFTLTGGMRTNVPGCSPALCGFNTTAGGQYFHEARGGTVTFTFTNAISAFGAYFGGWQIGTQTITYDNGDTVTLEMGDANGSGGLRFFGFVDAGASIASITYNAVNDIVSIDDVRIDATPVPLPAALPMLTAGLLGLGLMRRRRKQA